MSIRRRAVRTVGLEFGPQYDELQAILRGAKRTLRSGTRAERQMARAIVRSSKAVRPQVKRDYRQAQRTGRRADRMLARDMGGERNIFSDAVGVEQAGFARRTGEAQARELTELGNRQLRARDAQVQNTRSLRADFGEAKAGVQQGRQKLAVAEGQAVADLISKMRDEQADRAMDEAKLHLDQQKFGLDRRKFRLDREDTRADNARQEREDRSSAKKGGLTYAQRRDRKADIAQARSWLVKLRSAGVSLSDAKGLLVRGEKIPTKGGDDVSLPEIPAQFVDAALRELRSHGGIQGFFNRLQHSFR